MDSTQLAHVDDSEDYGFDLILDNQLYTLSSFLPTQTSEITAALTESFPNPGMSEFIVLLQSLEVQFINGETSQFRLFPRLLGRGGFSDVKYEQISDALSGKAVAVKELKPESTNQDHMTSVSNMPTNALAQAFIEVCIMKHPDISRHHNIVQLIGITDNATMMPLTDLGPLCLVMEYSQFGSLEFYTRSHPKETDFDTKVKLIDDITRGLQALHSCDVVHNDLKASNILLFIEGPDRRLTAKLSDFGCSFVLASYKSIKGAGATLLYAAPEAYATTCLVKPSRDMYSLGLMIMQIMMEERPFEGIQSDRLWEFKCSKEMPEYIVNRLQSASAPSHMLELVKKLLIADPNERLSDTNTVLRDLHQGDVNSIVLSDYPSEINERAMQSVDEQSGGSQWFIDTFGVGRSLTTFAILTRAEVFKSGDAALDVALCHEYGIGVPPSSSKCLSWLEKAALLGNTPALVFLKSVQPNLRTISSSTEMHLEISGFSISDGLVQYCHRLQNENLSVAEKYRVMDILWETEPEVYVAVHSSLRYCCCNSKKRSVLNLLWDHFLNSPEEPLTPYIESQLAQGRYWKDNRGRTTMHLLAACRHPWSGQEGVDIIRRIAEVLVSRNYHADLDDNGRNPLALAIIAKNYSVVDLLLECGSSLQDHWDIVEHAAEDHEYVILQKVLPFVPVNDDLETHILEAFRLVFSVIIPERKLRYGRKYSSNGKKTIQSFCSFLSQHSIAMSGESVVKILKWIIRSGGDDQLKDFVEFFPSFPEPLSKILNGNQLLAHSVGVDQSKVFSVLLEMGADINGSDGNGTDDSPLLAAAGQYDHNPFYFETLMSLGANIILTEHEGAVVLLRLIGSKNAGNVVSKILREYPHFLYYARIEPSGSSWPLVRMAVQLGLSDTVKAILDSGYDITSIDTESGSTALDWAVDPPRPECIENLKLLLSYEQNVSDAGKHDRLGGALARACLGGNVPAIQMLLEHGADPNFYNKERLSPLICIHLRHVMFNKNREFQLTVLGMLEQIKFEGVYQMLLDYGLEEIWVAVAKVYCENISDEYYFRRYI